MSIAGRLALTGVLLASGAGTLARAQDVTLDRGRQLFTGAIPFTHGGPACASCHDTAALARPGGGTMGPDLTDVAARIGPEGVATALNTLYFPTMVPLFAAHPLTADEQQTLAMFLEHASSSDRRPASATVALGVATLVGGAILLTITGFVGRSRVHSVRLALLARAAARRKVMP